MRTRNGCVYPRPTMAMELDTEPQSKPPLNLKSNKRKFKTASLDLHSPSKPSVRRRVTINQQNDSKMAINGDEIKEINQNGNEGFEFFDELPDDLIVSILSKLSGSALSPSDLFNARLSCKRFNKLGQDSWVLAKASVKALSFPAKKWSDSAHRFLQMCCDAGNIEACYILGMISFYCLQALKPGLSLLARAATSSHAPALYSLSIIQFNGSGGSKADKNLRAGVTLCARAARLGHVPAIRELGHCLQDGYGIPRHVIKGRRLILEANCREIALNRQVPGIQKGRKGIERHVTVSQKGLEEGVSGEWGGQEVNEFMAEWWGNNDDNNCSNNNKGGNDNNIDGDVRGCGYGRCGRVETRRSEFRRCAVCGKVTYCSRACQAMDWRRKHREECGPPVNDMWGLHLQGY